VEDKEIRPSILDPFWLLFFSVRLFISKNNILQSLKIENGSDENYQTANFKESLSQKNHRASNTVQVAANSAFDVLMA